MLSRIHNNPRRYRGPVILILCLSSVRDNSSSSCLRLRAIEPLVVPVALHALEKKAHFVWP
jgi:hypothetical protein